MDLAIRRFLDTKGRILEAIAALVVQVDLWYPVRLEMMLVEINYAMIGYLVLRPRYVYLSMSA